MVTTQFLMSRNLDQLNQLFLDSRLDPEILEQIQDELKYRQMPQALELLVKVRAVLADVFGASGVASARP